MGLAAHVAPLLIRLNSYRRINAMPNFHGERLGTEMRIDGHDLSGLVFDGGDDGVFADAQDPRRIAKLVQHVFCNFPSGGRP